MTKVSIAAVEEAPISDLPHVFAGTAETRAVFNRQKDPLHLYLHRLAPDTKLLVGPKTTDCMIYVWRGAVEAGGRKLTAGSSLIVEHGATIEIGGTHESAQLLTFSAAEPGAKQRAGGHVHLLPTEQVPRAENLAGTHGVSGAMHADAACPTCEVWLHENSLAAPLTAMTDADMERGVHSHTEDEIIFVIGGEMRLGARLCGPGTAIAIAANTFYTFGVGSEGLKFINFRAGLPSEIRFKAGHTMDEVAFWRDRVGRPQYLAPLQAVAT